MACIDDVYKIQNPLWNGYAEQSEADYESDLGREVGVFDMVRHPMGSSSSAPRDQQSPPLRRPLAALGNSQRVAAVAGARKQKRERDPDEERARRIVRKQVHGVMARISDWRDSGTNLLDELAEKTFFTTKKTRRGARAGQAAQDRRRDEQGQFAAYVEEGVMVDVSTSPNDKENEKSQKKLENWKKAKNIK